MLDNMMVIDRLRLKSLENDGHSYAALIMMDYVFVKEEDGTYSVLKNRHNGEKDTGLTAAELWNGVMTIALEKANGR